MTNNSNMSITKNNPNRKHLCPKCCEPLKAVTVGNIINHNETGKSSKSTASGTYLSGEVRSYQTQFQCPSCRLSYTLDDLRKIEQSYKR